MDEQKLNEEQMDDVNGGSAFSDSVEYVVEQGKKVAQVVADTFEKLIKKE
ncbi:MAG: hypothetical protein J5916_07680 [Oscillospiraceae bacterium]|nr:hypothetical protein [Oscillospiraceae bacterium]